MATELEKTGIQLRLEHLSKNHYTEIKPYNSDHLNALSNGDEKGKGEFNGQVGSLTDINTRTENLIKNEYKTKNPYNSDHLNALSNGDEKGKGEVNGQVGSLTDINTRTENLIKNEKYGPNKKSYPDFTI